MRLTSELIETAPQFANPLRERELDLRGNKIPQIENLGITEDGFDTIDLSDNEITKLENFPLLQRLQTIILHNNRICRVASGLGKVLPNLKTLVMHNNHFRELHELAALADIPSLQRLSLIDNPVCKVPGYRMYVIATCPKIKQLDYKKISPKERKQAEDVYGGKGKEVGKASVAGETVEPVHVLTEEEQEKIKAQIEAATSFEEIAALEQRLLGGLGPSAASSSSQL